MTRNEYRYVPLPGRTARVRKPINWFRVIKLTLFVLVGGLIAYSGPLGICLVVIFLGFFGVFGRPNRYGYYNRRRKAKKVDPRHPYDGV